MLVEVVNGDWAANHFPQDPDGNVYSARRPWTDLSYLGTSPQSYINTGYSKTSNASENDWTDLINLTFFLNNTPDSTYAQQVRQAANVEEWMGYFALHTMMAFDETALGNGAGDDLTATKVAADKWHLNVNGADQKKVAEIQLTAEAVAESVELFTITLAGEGSKGEFKMIWGTTGLETAFTGK